MLGQFFECPLSWFYLEIKGAITKQVLRRKFSPAKIFFAELDKYFFYVSLLPGALFMGTV